MTLKRLSLLTLTFGALAPLADAALVNIATNTLAPGFRLVATSNGNPLPVGSMVRIGIFPAGAPTITPTTTFAQINALFVPIGESSLDANDGTNGPGVTNTTAAAGGGWGFTINNVSNTDARFGATTRIFLMVLDVPPAEMQNAKEALIMSDAGWTIPSTGTRTMTTAQIDVDTEVTMGTWGATQLRSAAFVPEPSTGALALLAGLGVVTRRRRR